MQSESEINQAANYTAQGIAETVLLSAEGQKDRVGTFFEGARWACRTIIARADRGDRLKKAIVASREEDLERLVLCLVENDPDTDAADGGITVLDVWRKDARRVLGE